MPSNSNPDVRPIGRLECLGMRQANAGKVEALTPAQRRAYRRLAIYALGMDIATLTRDLRARRLERMPEQRLVPTSDLAA